MKTLTYNNSNVEVIREVDVLVVGGGLAGVAAAVSSARTGAKTLLVERNSYPGGVATAGHCCSVYNCMCKASGELAIKGVPYDIVDALACRAGGPGKSWLKHRGHIIYDIEQAKLVLWELLDEAGAEFLPSLTVCDALKDGNRAIGAVVAGRKGLKAILAKNIVDASGDSDYAYLAGVPMRTNYGVASYCFRFGNVDMDRFVDYFKENPGQYPEKMDVEWSFEDAVAQYKENGTFLFPHGGGFQLKIVNDAVEAGIYPKTCGCHDSLSAMQMHGIRKTGTVHIITGFTRINDMSAEQIAKATVDGRGMANIVADFFKKNMPGFENSYVASTADNLGIRTSRYIVGKFDFKHEMRTAPTRFDDAVGIGVAETMKVMHPGKGAWSAQVLSDDIFEIPLSCMLPNDIDNLIMGAGRSVSSVNPSTLRVMVTTMVVGQAAGAAAALASVSGKSVKEIDAAEVREQVKKFGFEFPEK
jgi:hypothetical protein